MNSIEIKQFKLLQGTGKGVLAFPDENGLICFFAKLPVHWNEFNYAVLSIKVNAEEKAVVHFGLAESESDKPILSMDYRILQKCNVKIPFPIDKESLNAEHWFLPPWPGVFKGNYSGKSVRAEQVHCVKITVLAPKLVSAEIPKVILTDDWQPTVVTGEALVDEFGQCKSRSWTGKTTNFSEMEKRLKEEFTAAKNDGHYPEGWSVWGGWQGKKLTATGWFHCEKCAERWWLVDPDGYAFFSNGVCYGNRTGIYAMEDHLDALYEILPPKDGLYKACWTSGDKIPQFVVRNGQENAKKRTLVNYPRANMMRVFGENWLDAWITINTARMKKAGINTLGVGVNDYADEYTSEFLQKAKMPYVITVKYFPLTREKIFRDFPDVFSPEYETLATETAKASLMQYRDDPFLIGYFITNEPEWYSYDDVNLSLKLLECNGCESSKRAFIDFLRRKYADIADLNAAWGTDFSDYCRLLKPVRIDSISETMLSDCKAFHSVLVEKYGDVISSCFRKVDPHHLNLGMRYARLNAEKAEQAFCEGIRQFDVFSYNCYGAEPVSTAAILAEYKDMPAIIGEWHIGSIDSGLDVGGLYYTDTQAERANAIEYYLEQSTQASHLVGIHYFEYSDQPYLGRFDGECYQIGLIDVCNRPYYEVFNALESFASRMYPLLLGECETEAKKVPLCVINS